MGAKRRGLGDRPSVGLQWLLTSSRQAPCPAFFLDHSPKKERLFGWRSRGAAYAAGREDRAGQAPMEAALER